MRDPDEVMEIEAKRQRLVEEAVLKADHIICEGADGDIELLNWLTSQVAKKFMMKALAPFATSLLVRDMDIHGK